MNVIQPTLYPMQRAALFDEARYSIIESSTKAGKTVGGLVWQSTAVLEDTRRMNHWWVAPVYGQAEIAFRRAVSMYGGLAGVKINRSDLLIEFPNGARWVFRSGEKPDNLFGEDVATVVFDEFTRAREEAWHAIRSTITATRGRVRFLGNVRGRGWGWKLARRAESGTADHAYHRITASDAVSAGVLDANEIEQAERDLPPPVFRELYFCEPADNAANPFGYERIKACISDLSDLSDREPVVFGVDLGRAQDYTAVVGLDSHGQVCRFARFNQIPWLQIIDRVANMVGDTPALLDDTGLGAVVLESIQQRCPNVMGYTFTAQSKQRLMMTLAAEISAGTITYPAGPIPDELETFEYRYHLTRVEYTAPEGLHDDCVCALALAVWHQATMPKDTYVESAIIRVYDAEEAMWT